MNGGGEREIDSTTCMSENKAVGESCYLLIDQRRECVFISCGRPREDRGGGMGRRGVGEGERQGGRKGERNFDSGFYLCLLHASNKKESWREGEKREVRIALLLRVALKSHQYKTNEAQQ